MTDDNVVIDTPINLIKQGIFDSLFPKDLIVFDEIIGGFKVKK